MKKRIWIIFVFLFVFFLSGYSMNTQEYLTQEEAACRFLDKGEIDKAVEILQNVLTRKPNNFNAQLYLGIALYMKRDVDEALKRFENIEKELDRMVGSSRPFGDETMFTQMGMERKADLLFSEERKGLLSFFLGLSLKEKKNFKNAEKMFKKALKQEYDEMVVRVQLFDLYVKMNDLKSASKQMVELKRISGEGELFIFLDGYMKYRKGSLEDALAAMEKISPSNVEAKKNIARLHYNKGNYQRAVEIWQDILSQFPDDKEGQIEIGRAYFHVGDSEKAQEYFTAAGVQTSPEKYSPKNVPLIYENLLKELKFNLRCK